MDVESGTATPRSPVSVSVRLRGHDLVQDKPAAAGGQDKGPMASELLLAALLGCQHSTFFKIAAKRRTDAKVERLDGDLHFDAAGDIAKAEVRFTIRTASTVADSALETLVRLTDGACTISKALKVPVHGTFVRA
ncbi:MAG: OsmC family protein [Halobacteriales archaeon]|nr:OsmC family protein [Halobacteriales archaeon]